MRTISAKVAAILNSTQIALNAGARQGVRINDKVRLYRSVQITDPDSGEDLGGVQLTKLNLRVNHVQDLLCTAVVTDFEGSSGASDLFSITKVRRSKEIATQTGPGKQTAVLVKVGEPAVIEGTQKSDEDPL